MKLCRRCGLEKSPDDFSPRLDRPGRHFRCRDCVAHVNRERYAATGGERSKRYYLANREAIGVKSRSKYVPHPRQPKTVPCRYCLQPFPPGRFGPGQARVFCSDQCRRMSALIGATCPITNGECDVCGLAFTGHGRYQRKRCSEECRRGANRRANLETQRRTHGIAIRYWTVGDSPAAREIARVYFDLRSELRRKRNGTHDYPA